MVDYRRWSLAAIARACDISLGEFVQFWQKAQVERAITIACAAAPDVVEAMASAALGREVVCERCDGLGSVEIPAGVPPELVPGYLGRVADHPARRVCPWCASSGKIRKPGDPHAIDRVLEIARLIGKRLVVQQTVTYDFKGGFERLNRVMLDAPGGE